MNKFLNLWTVSFKNTDWETIANWVCASPITGLCHGQTVGCWGLSGVFSLHLWEEHPQRVPYSCSGLHQQATAARQTQPDPPAVQTPAAPAQQVWAPLLHLQKGEGQELFGNVNGELHPHNESYTIPCALVWGRGWVPIATSLTCGILPHPPKKHLSEQVDTPLSSLSWALQQCICIFSTVCCFSNEIRSSAVIYSLLVTKRFAVVVPVEAQNDST